MRAPTKMRANRSILHNKWNKKKDTLKKLAKQVDWFLLGPVLILMVVGIVMVYSASADMPSGSAVGYFTKQAAFDVSGLALIAVLFRLPIHWQSIGVRRIVGFFALLSIVVLLVTLFIGPVINGARGWIIMGSASFQPVEVFKVLLVLGLAYLLSQDKQNIAIPEKREQRLWWVYMLLLLAGIVIDFMMPDMGGTIILVMIGLVMYLAARHKPAWTVGLIALIGVVYAAIPYIAHVFDFEHSNNYQLARFTAFVDPWAVASTSGLQVINSMYAISNGGFFGRGLGNSLQKFGNLPEPNTDFIMAIVAEELGVIAVIVILALMYLIIFRMILWGMRTKNMFYRLTLYGFAVYLFMQVFINFGGVIGALPITGVTFPFISYGGTSIWSLTVSIGIALNTIKQVKFEWQHRAAEENRNGRI